MNLYNSYQKLYKLTQQQQVSITDSNFDKLLNILKKKKDLINNISQIDTENYLRNHDNPSAALKNLQEIMQKIKDLEEKNEKDLRQKKEKLYKQVKQFNLKQKGRKGYRQHGEYEAKFIDKKS